MRSTDRLGLRALCAALLFAGHAPAAMADTAPSSRLVPCGTESCLLISGKRVHAAVPVRINGHVVEAEGQRRWRVRLPVSTVRAWSRPFARTIEVAVSDHPGSDEVDLPIGLLGHIDLASLVVSVR